jgi:Holliday junction resolvase RusA-like endonuclease
VTISLPYPPSTNHAYTVRNGRKIKSATARAYAHEVGWRVADHVRTGEQPPERWDGRRLHVTIDVHPPDARRRDISNTEKLCVDAVAYQLGFDDSQIDVLTLRRQPVDRTNPRLVLTLEAIE